MDLEETLKAVIAISVTLISWAHLIAMLNKTLNFSVNADDDAVGDTAAISFDSNGRLYECERDVLRAGSYVGQCMCSVCPTSSFLHSEILRRKTLPSLQKKKAQRW